MQASSKVYLKENYVQLSESSLLGSWTITTQIGGEVKQSKSNLVYDMINMQWHLIISQSKKRSVELAEYVLPKCEVTIDSPSHVSITDGKFRAIIRSKYTYGKGVKGVAFVTLKSSDGNAITCWNEQDGKRWYIVHDISTNN